MKYVYEYLDKVEELLVPILGEAIIKKEISSSIEAKKATVAFAPLSPSWANPFGTDQFGYDMFAKIMLGAKYTIIAAMGVAAVRMFIAVPLGFVGFPMYPTRLFLIGSSTRRFTRSKQSNRV